MVMVNLTRPHRFMINADNVGSQPFLDSDLNLYIQPVGLTMEACSFNESGMLSPIDSFTAYF